MQFLTDNLVWVIMVLIVIIMAVIGYFADKKGFGATFGNKQDDENKNNKTKAVNVPERIEIPNKPIDEIIYNSAKNSVNEENSQLVEDQPINIPDENTITVINEDAGVVEIPDDLFEPITVSENQEEIIETKEEVDTPVEETTVSDVQELVEEPIEETPASDIQELVEENEDSKVQETVEETVSEDTAAGSEWTIKEEKEEETPEVETEEEDIWKF